MKTKLKNINTSRIKYVSLSFLMFILITSSILIYLESRIKNQSVAEHRREDQRIIELAHDYIELEMSAVLSDLHYLLHANEDKLSTSTDYSEIIDNWIIFSTQSKIYDQIRFIDATGMEKIRINFRENGAYQVSDDQLQNKYDRYFFQETIKLNDDEFYISPLDLNMENGVVEMPYKPVIRLCTPVYNKDNSLRGILVVNYLAKNLLDAITRIGESTKSELILLNANGYNLSSDDDNDNWNFMFDERKDKSFAKKFLKEWPTLVQNQAQFLTENGLFTSRAVNLDKFIKEENHNINQVVVADRQWILVAYLKRSSENSYYFNDDFMASTWNVIQDNHPYLLFITAISAGFSALFFLYLGIIEKIQYNAAHDSLTNCYNRRAGLIKINNLFHHSHRRKFQACLCYVDINGLKTINDTLGHKAGDELIITATKAMHSTIREDDFIIRLGGDEFLVVFFDSDASQGELAWARITNACEVINQSENRPYILSLSHGIVAFENSFDGHIESLIHAADELMYQEKANIKLNMTFIRSLDSHHNR